MNTEFLGSLYDLLPSCKELLNPLAMKLISLVLRCQGLAHSQQLKLEL